MGPPSARPRREKGKEKEKDADRSTSLAPLFISEESFEFIMGVLEKYIEDKVPTLDMVRIDSLSV